jgi:hypothetical protein
MRNKEVDGLAELECSKCGKKVETIPQHCGHDMIYNDKEERWECYMGANCGYIGLDEFVCDECCE